MIGSLNRFLRARRLSGAARNHSGDTGFIARTPDQIGGRLLSGLSCLALVSSLSLNAQSNAEERVDSEVLTLTPFEVTAESDTGYAAQNTLSGTRLNTATKDVGGTMTVITPQLWEDLGLLNTNDLINFTPGSEKEELQSSEGPGQATFFGDNTRVRGIKTENIVRNGFRTNLPSDVYNASRFEFQRGPNAILFGTTGAGGGAAGLVNRTTEDARFNNSNRYDIRLDEFGSVRHSLTLNRELLPDQLAVRVSLLDDQTDYWVKPTFQNQRRFYGAVTYRPIENLSIKLRYESMDWLRTAYEAGMHFDGVTAVLDAAAAAGVSPADLALTSKFNVPATNLPDYLQNNGFRNQNTTSIVYGAAGASPTLENWRYKIIGANPTVVGSNRLSLPEGIVPLDFNIYGRANTQDFQGYNFNAAVQYKVNEKIDVEYAYNKELMVYDFVSSAATRLQIDMAATLQDGVTPNPNVGRYFTDTYPGFALWQDRYLENHRLTTSLVHDFRENDMSWLGKHSFAVMYEDANQTHYWDQMRLLNTTPLAGYLASPLWNGQQQNAIRFANYVDPQSYSISGVHNATLFKAAANEIPGVTAEWLPVIGSGQAFDETTRSLLGVWQGRFWDNRVITTAGVRKDKFKRLAGEEFQDPDQPLGIAIPSSEIVMTEDLTQASLDPVTKNYGVVVHALVDQGAIDYLSPYFNYSDSFGSGVFNTLPDGSKAPNSTGDTTDYGLKFGLFDNRVSGVFSIFKSSNFDNTDVRSIDFTAMSDLFEFINGPQEFINVSNIRETQDIVSEGYEFQLTTNITSNWRATLSYDHFSTELQNIAPTTAALIAQYQSQWLANPSAIVPATNRTAQQEFDDLNFSYLRTIAQEGSVTMNERANKFTFLTNYSFTDGPLKGVNVGGNIIWQDKAVTGFALQDVGGSYVPDPANPFYGDDLLRLGAHVGYRRPLFNDRIKWRVQLNIQDIGTVKPFVVREGSTAVAPSTPVATYYHRGFPQTISLTNTFEF